MASDRQRDGGGCPCGADGDLPGAVLYGALGMELADMKTTIEMAREAGFSEWAVKTPRDLERFAELVRADEREAMVAKAAKKGWGMRNDDPFEDCVREIADIRARGNT